MAKTGPKKGNATNRSRGGAKAKAKSRTVAKVLVKASKKGSGKGPRSQKAVAKVNVKPSKTAKQAAAGSRLGGGPEINSVTEEIISVSDRNNCRPQ